MTFVETSNLAGAALASRRGNSSWTNERELEVRKLWMAGYTASQIAVEIGGTTRNAVIGKLHRAGLTMNHRTPGVTIKCDPSARVANSKPGRRPDGYRRMPDRRPAKPLQQLFEAPTPVAVLDIPPHERVSLLALTGESCRYPIGDPRASDFGFCNKSHARGLPYCGFHARICYQPPIARQDKRSRT